MWLRPEGIGCFCGDLSDEEQKLVWATHQPPAADIFQKKAKGTAWKTKPSWYIVGSNDKTVNPELERFVAARMNARVTALDSSHVPMLSQPQRVLEVIRAACEGSV